MTLVTARSLARVFVERYELGWSFGVLESVGERPRSCCDNEWEDLYIIIDLHLVKTS
jgi:hypothetical protein